MQKENTRGLETPARQAVSTPNADEYNLAHTGFVSWGCEFTAPTREEFRADGLVMDCPDCRSTRAEHEFEEVA